MSTLTTKKQNHILYVTLAVLLVTAAVLSVLTFNAGKKETENLPETETKQIEQAKPESKLVMLLETLREQAARMEQLLGRLAELAQGLTAPMAAPAK